MAENPFETGNGWTPLLIASAHGYAERVRALLEAGADALQPLRTPQSFELNLVDALPSIALFDLHVLRLLCAYAPLRREAIQAMRADFPPLCLDWLAETCLWTSPLHHVEFISSQRVRELIVDRADVLARANRDMAAPTPLSIACALLQDGCDERAELIVRAATPWSPETHAHFPARVRQAAVNLFLVGVLLANERQRLAVDGEVVERALVDVWVSHVMAIAVQNCMLNLSPH